MMKSNIVDEKGFKVGFTSYDVCSRCVMDISDPLISFNEEGVCNYCQSFEEHPERYGKVSYGLERWKFLVEEIKEKGKNNPYDCIIGVSGGVDSSFVCYVAEKAGLRCVIVHVNNGFDSEVSRHNVKRIFENTGFFYVERSVPPEEFRDVQVAYLKSGVIDADVPSDYLIEHFVRKTALRYDIPYVLSGGNYFADCFMPTSWNYPYKSDWTNLRNIHRQFGNGVSLKHFPKHGALRLMWIHGFKLQYVKPLNYVGYDRFKAKKTLEREWKWKDYGEKHGENILSRFYQNYILYRKYGVDKRRANYSNYIRSGGMTREEALKRLKSPPWYNAADLYFILDKLGLTYEEFIWIMDEVPIRSHEEFGSNRGVMDWWENLKNYPLVGGALYRGSKWIRGRS